MSSDSGNCASASPTESNYSSGTTDFPTCSRESFPVKRYVGEEEPSRGINSDEAIACGAAVQESVSSGEVLLLTMGIETVGGVMTKLIARKTACPTKKSQVFSTVFNNQTTVTIQVYEGEGLMTKDNHFLGRLDLTGIPPALRGVPQIEVTFELDIYGDLCVTAEVKGTGNKNTLTSSMRGLTPGEIERMVSDAEKIKELVEACNELARYAYWLKNQAKDGLKDKLDGEDKKVIEEAAESAISWLQANSSVDVETIKEKKADKLPISWWEKYLGPDAKIVKKKKVEIEAIVTPIISKPYQHAESHEAPMDEESVKDKL